MKVVGITGTIGSGKEVVSDALKKKFNSYYVSLSSVIRGELEKRKKLFNRVSLQDMGNEMRKKYGTHILAMLAVEYLGKDKEMIIIDGIRNPGEAEYLRKKFQGDFKLIAVDAPKEVRFERMLKRSRPTDPKTKEEFEALDKRDEGEGESLYGQQTRKCFELADFCVVNNGSMERFEAKIKEVIQKL